MFFRDAPPFASPGFSDACTHAAPYCTGSLCSSDRDGDECRDGRCALLAHPRSAGAPCAATGARDEERTARDQAKERRRARERAAATTSSAARGSSSSSNAWDKRDAPNAGTSSAPERAERGKLTENAQKQLQSLLRTVTMERAHIRAVMGFCLDHADASREVVETIADALDLDETPIPKKIARSVDACARRRFILRTHVRVDAHEWFVILPPCCSL